jgi:hypothetical protein
MWRNSLDVGEMIIGTAGKTTKKSEIIPDFQATPGKIILGALVAGALF